MRTPTKSRLRQFSDTVSELEVEGAFRTLSEARKLEQEGHSIIHLEIGEPDFPTPDAIAARGVQAIREGQTRYTPAAGLPLSLEHKYPEPGASRNSPEVDIQGLKKLRAGSPSVDGPWCYNAIVWRQILHGDSKLREIPFTSGFP